MTIETVRGNLSDETAAEILAFWEERGALSGDAAQKRLREVVCVLRGSDGEIAGVNSVYAEEVPLVGNRVFWVYRSLMDARHPRAGSTWSAGPSRRSRRSSTPRRAGRWASASSSQTAMR